MDNNSSARNMTNNKRDDHTPAALLAYRRSKPNNESALSHMVAHKRNTSLLEQMVGMQATIGGKVISRFSKNAKIPRHSLHCQHAFLFASRELQSHGLSRTMARHATE